MFLGCIVICAIAIGEPPKEMSGPAKRELKTLAGKWRIEKIIHSDRETSPGTGDDSVIFEFHGAAINFSKAATGTVVELDPECTPKCLDIQSVTGFGIFRKGMTYESVYKLDGDTMTWAVYIGRGKNRPMGFDRPMDEQIKVIVFSRVKEQ